MHSSLLIILTSIFGGTLYVAPPQAAHFAFVSFKNGNSTTDWIEMRPDFIDGFRVFKYKFHHDDFPKEQVMYKFKYAFKNYTTETDWVKNYLTKNSQEAILNNNSLVDLITMWFCIFNSCLLIVFIVKKLIKSRNY